MIRAGDSIENPVTGERIVFRKTSAETNGEAVVIECFVKPNGAVAMAHVHPSQDERFEVLKGSLTLKLDGKELPAGPGDRILVPAGMKHQFWNAGRRGGALRLRDSAGAQVRAADRDDVLARRRRQDQQEGDAEPTPAGRDRARHVRHGAAAVPAGLDAADRPDVRLAARPSGRVQADLRVDGGTGRERGRHGVRRGRLQRRLFWTALIVAFLLLWLIGQVLRAAEATAAAARRVSHRVRRTATVGGLS